LDEPTISWSQHGDAPAGEAEPVAGNAKEAADEAMLLALSAALGLEPDVAGPVLVDDRGREALDALVGRAAAQGFEDAIGLLHQDCQDQEEAERPEGSASSLAENEEEAPEASAQAAAEQPTVAQAAAEQPTVAPAAAEQPTVAPAAARSPPWRRLLPHKPTWRRRSGGG